MDKIITISREYGAGGHSIGQQVAKELGIPFYDRADTDCILSHFLLTCNKILLPGRFSKICAFRACISPVFMVYIGML